jgi:beta-glucosidase
MVTVIISGNAVAMPWLPKVSTLVQSWYLGSEAGHALADVLSGDVTPSGKTIFTYAKRLEDYPAHRFGLVGYPGVRPADLPAEHRYKDLQQPKSADLLAALPKYKKAAAPAINTSTDPKTHEGNGDEVEVYAEDIMVGYRYFDTMNEAVVFPFGYGLSYTTFKYSGATIAPTADGYAATVTVTNTGKVAGKETVQLYVGCEGAQVVCPQKELKGFCKVSLQPGESQTVTIPVPRESLRYYDENRQQWTDLTGHFKAYIGSSSRDIRAKIDF